MTPGSDPTAEEARRLVVEVNATGAPYPSQSSISRLFEEQANRAPDSVALVDRDGQLTYGELNARANGIAARLRAIGLARGDRAVLYLDRSPAMIAAILGVLKAGGAYVPLDPGCPAERTAWAIEDVEPAVIITDPRYRATLPPTAAPVMCLEQDAADVTETGDGGDAVEAGDLAYIMYTSGSTGTPKGVSIEHRGVVRLVRGAGYARFGPDEVFLQLAPASFDASTFEIWGSLLNGGRLAIAPPGPLSLEALARLVEEFRVTTLWLTAGLFHQMADGPLSRLTTLRQLLAGGDVLSVPHVRRALEALPGCRIINGYGPTENTTFTCCHPISAATLDGASVPIGRPISNTRVYILDGRGAFCPPGTAGELHIAGDGLARGYWNRPELTAEKFIPSPFPDVEPGRLYRSGDICRYRPDGDIEFLGRRDHQWKIRGYRVELGEVEAVLAKHPDVAACAAAVRDDAAGRRLVAYLVATPEASEARTEPTEPDAPSEQVEQWRSLYEQIYGPGHPPDPTFDTTGWNSSYTGQPLPAEDMREWLDESAGRVLGLRPRRLLEIGCGTGLLLFRVAPRCLRYIATDFSRRVIERLAAIVAPSHPSVELLSRSAEDFEGVRPRELDTVVLNSVVQYFPDVGYLMRVIGKAVESVEDGGAIFIGDVRSLPLLEPFHLSVEIERAPSSMRVDELRERVRRRVAQEEELVIDPAFFPALADHFPRIGAVEVLPKLGRRDNEMNRYRYDVVIRVGPHSADRPGSAFPDRAPGAQTVSEVETGLEEGTPLVAFSKVPNARIARDLHALDRVRSSNGDSTVEELRDALRLLPEAGIHPADLSALAARRLYRVDMSWSASHPGGEFDVLFRSSGGGADAPSAFPGERIPSKPWREYANDPLRTIASRRLVARVRTFAREKLPEYMVPSAFVTMDALPLTAAGKVDRNALPAPEIERAARGHAFSAPGTDAERFLARVWSELLGLDRVGLDDDFFELGGHSVLAMRVISRIRESFGVELPLGQLFETSTVARLAAVLDETAAGDAPRGLRLRSSRSAGEIPLSFGQQRFWFLDQLEPGGSSYNIGSALHLRGTLDTEALARALTEIVRRHESLRTRFPATDGRPRQVVDEPRPVRLRTVELRDDAAMTAMEKAAGLAVEDVRDPYDLARGPLFRCALYRLGAEEHVLVLAMHHIVSDGWSLSVLFRELHLLYKAFSRGEPSPLPDLAAQYADFAIWQRETLREEILARELTYWKGRLGSAPPVLELHGDRPRPEIRTEAGGAHTFRLDERLAAAVRDLARRESATSFMTLLSAFLVFLAHQTGRTDLIVGCPSLGRSLPETEDMIGLFVTTLVLRTDLGGAPTFREVLARVRETVLGANAHRNVPLERIVDELRVPRSLSYNPLFQVWFVLDNAPVHVPQLDDLVVRPLRVESAAVRHDLHLTVREFTGAMEATLEYSSDLFDRETIRRLAGELEVVLYLAVSSPNAPLTRFHEAIDAERERRRMLEQRDMDLEMKKRLEAGRRKAVRI